MDIFRKKTSVPELRRRFSIKERKQIERELFGWKWRKGSGVPREKYEEKLMILTRQRLRAKTSEDKQAVERKIRYLKKVGKPK